MPLDLALDLAHALDPVAFVQDRLKFEPDPWQASLLRSRAPWTGSRTRVISSMPASTHTPSLTNGSAMPAANSAAPTGGPTS